MIPRPPQSLKMGGGESPLNSGYTKQAGFSPHLLHCNLHTVDFYRLSESLVICRKVLVIILPLVVEKQRYIRQSFILFIYFFWSRISWSSSRLRLRCEKKMTSLVTAITVYLLVTDLEQRSDNQLCWGGTEVTSDSQLWEIVEHFQLRAVLRLFQAC